MTSVAKLGRNGGTRRMRVIQERDGSNTPVVSYTRGTDLSGSLEGAGGIGGLLGRSHGYSSGNWSTHNFYQADGNGNVTYLVNSSQTLAASYRYDAYGNLLGYSGSLAAANTYRFSSKEQHAQSGMYYYGYRWYVPALQRWLNRDPIGERGGINLYGFVGNAPINRQDARGLFILDEDGFPVMPTGTPLDAYLREPQPPSRNPNGQGPQQTDATPVCAAAASGGFLGLPKNTGRAVGAQMSGSAALVAILFMKWERNVNSLPKDPDAIFYVPMGFGFGSVTYWDPDYDEFVHHPAMMMIDTPIVISIDPVFTDELERRMRLGPSPLSPMY